jgi:hypothetical protein
MPITNYLPSSRLIQPGVCTSTTRPATPFEGQAIFETDTDKVLYWSGTAWYPAWNTPWGHIASTTSISNTVTSGILTGLNTSFTAVANRRYKISVKVVAYIPSGGRLIINCAGERLIDDTAGAAGFPVFFSSFVRTFTAGTQNLTVDFSIISGAVGANASSGVQHQLVIEDIGPA